MFETATAANSGAVQQQAIGDESPSSEYGEGHGANKGDSMRKSAPMANDEQKVVHDTAPFHNRAGFGLSKKERKAKKTKPANDLVGRKSAENLDSYQEIKCRKRSVGDLMDELAKQNSFDESERCSKRSKTSDNGSALAKPAVHLRIEEAVGGTDMTPSRRIRGGGRGLLASVKKAKAATTTARRNAAQHAQEFLSNKSRSTENNQKMKNCHLTVPKAPTFASELLRQQRESANCGNGPGIVQQHTKDTSSHHVAGVASSQTRVMLTFADKQVSTLTSLLVILGFLLFIPTILRPI